MIASIIARQYGGGDEVKLSLRIATPTMKNAVALNVSVDKDRWLEINKSMKLYSKAYRRGSVIEVESGLKSQLWDITRIVEAQYQTGALTLERVKAIVANIMYRDVAKDAASVDGNVTSSGGKMSLLEWIRDFIAQCESGKRLKQGSTRRVAATTIKNYKGTLAQLESYCDVRHRMLDWDDMTLDFYYDWRRFFLEKRDKNGRLQPYSPNTIGRHVKNLKIFLYAAKDMKLSTVSDFESKRFAVDHQDVDNVYLTDERVQEMYESDFTDEGYVALLLRQCPDEEERDYLVNQLKRRGARLLNEAKDVFVVGCLTGQRVSDYKRIDESMIRTLDDGLEYIYLRQTKTEKWIYIPLDVRVKIILQRYGGKLPKVFDQDLNERIKVVGRMLGWNESAGIAEAHGLMEVASKKKFYECIKTHTARRTFATNAYKRKISLSSIMVVTGHSSESMLKKYLKLDKEEKAMLAAREFANARMSLFKAVD